MSFSPWAGWAAQHPDWTPPQGDDLYNTWAKGNPAEAQDFMDRLGWAKANNALEYGPPPTPTSTNPVGIDWSKPPGSPFGPPADPWHAMKRVASDFAPTTSVGGQDNVPGAKLSTQPGTLTTAGPVGGYTGPTTFPQPTGPLQTGPTTQPSPHQYWQNMFGPFSSYDTSFAAPQSQQFNYKSPFATDFINPQKSSFVNPFGN